jgi:hypothetical protein
LGTAFGTGFGADDLNTDLDTGFETFAGVDGAFTAGFEFATDLFATGFAAIFTFAGFLVALAETGSIFLAGLAVAAGLDLGLLLARDLVVTFFFCAIARLTLSRHLRLQHHTNTPG